MPEMPESVMLKNPRALELIEEELRHGAGRNATEVAENLVFIGAEQRRLRRATTPTVASANAAASSSRKSSSKN